MTSVAMEGYEKRGESKELIVVIHAYMSSSKRLVAVRNTIADQFPDADIFVPDLPAGWSSITKPVDIVQVLLGKIDILCGPSGVEGLPATYERIILVGHSLGALIARKLYVCACGEISDAPIEKEISAGEPRPWASRVERIILLAGMNRGWRISHHLSLLNASIWSIGTLWGNLVWLFRGTPPLIFSIRKGAPFITQLRLHWIHMRNHARVRKVGNALTIQLLGSIDDMVSPEDNIDLVSGHDFVYLDVPYSGHANIIEMDDPTPLPETGQVGSEQIRSVGSARSSVFLDALLKCKEELMESSRLPTDLPLERQHRNVTDVIFVIHGIRDLGYWTHKVARRILALASHRNIGDAVLATETSSYGYFPMLPFLLPTKRREKVEWMMDQYAEALALYPNAKFSFVGHSNGTYLLTRALRDYPLCRFKNVVLAGSVVRTHYDWNSAITRGQVKKVLNYVATADWVVAFFPRAIQMLRIQDLGSAGHDGFDLEEEKSKNVAQIKYVKGGHGAALNESNWDAIAEFVLTGHPQDPPLGIKGEAQSWLVKIPGLVAPLIWLLILAIVFSVFRMIWGLEIQEWARTLVAVSFGWAIWKVVTVI